MQLKSGIQIDQNDGTIELQNLNKWYHPKIFRIQDKCKRDDETDSTCTSLASQSQVQLGVL
jgi:hypothetical protein